MKIIINVEFKFTKLNSLIIKLMYRYISILDLFIYIKWIHLI